MPNPSQESPSKAKNPESKDIDVRCTCKTKIEGQNLEHDCINCQWMYPNQDQDAILQSGTLNIFQRHKSGLKGHGCSLQLQNQDREPKFKT